MFKIMIKAIVFDCFGVLVVDALGAILDQLKEEDPERADKIIEIIDSVIVNKIMIKDSQTQVAALLGMSREAYVDKLRTGETKNTKLLAYIEQLRVTHKTGMLSNVSKNGLAERFTPEELTKHFDAVVASGDIGHAKPHARAYEIAAEQLGVRLDECVMVDDRDEYCEGAQRVGMQIVKYVTFSQMKQDLEKLLLL